MKDNYYVEEPLNGSCSSAAVYVACREMGISITLKDIVASNLTYKDVSRNYRVLVFGFDIKIPITDPMKCVAKIANKLGISEKTKKQALNIMNEIIKREISPGKVPMGLWRQCSILLVD